MTVVRPNSIAGINSITVQTGQALNIHDASGNLIRNITSSSGVSTYSSLHIGAGTTNNSQGISIGVGASIVQNTANELHFFTSGINHLGINNEGQLTCQGAGSQLSLTKSGSDATEVTALLYTSNSGTHNQVTIKTSTNNGGDPFIKFDGGGSDMIVGERYAGTTNNLLVLGPGSNPDTTSGIFVKGTGMVGIGTDNPQVRLTVSSDSPAVMDVHHVDGGTNDEARIILGALAGSPPNNRGAGIAAVNNGAGHDLIIKTSPSHSLGPTEKVRVKSSGQVLIGTETEGHADADDLTIRTSSRTGMTIRSADDDYGNIFFSDATSGTGEYVGAVQYYHADNTLRLKTSSTDRLIINSTGDVNITGITTAQAFIPSSGQLSNRNIIINGAMTVAQRGTSESSTGYKTCDRWQLGGSWQGSAITQAQVDVSYTSIPYDKGFRKAFKITNSNQGSVAAGDNIEISYSFEGQDIAGSGWNYVATSGDDSKITLSFWIKSSVAQTFYGYFRTYEGTDMKYSFPIICSTTDWEYKTVTIGGEGNFASNVNDSFRMDNSKDLVLRFVPFYGTTYTDSGATNNAWQNYSSSTITPDYATTWMLTNASTMEITGVQLEVGPVATPFEHLTFAENLRRCQRYFQRLPVSGDHVMWGFGRAESNSARVQVPLSVPLRASPTITCSNNRSVKYDATMIQSTTTPTVFKWDDDFASIILDFPSGGSLSHNNCYIVTSDSGTTGLQMDSEL